MQEKIFDDDFFQKLNTLKLSLNMRLNQGMSGARKSGAKGTSVEFSDFREYMLGDDIRRIDWNAYGRMDKLFIKQFMEEKEGIYHIFLDTSKSMDYGEPKKSRLALQIAGALSYLVLNNLDRVYVTQMQENSLSEGKGLSGRNSYKKILAELNGIRFDGRTTLSGSIMSRNMKGRGLSVIISDFLDPAGIEAALRYLKYKKQQIVLVQVLAREELTITKEGSLNLIDSETGDIVRVTVNRKMIESYEEELKKLKYRLSALAKKYEAEYILAAADESIDKVMFEGMQAGGFVMSK